MNQHIATKNDVGIRVDKFLSNLYPEISRSFLAKNIQNFLLVDGKKVKQSYRLKEGQSVDVDFEKLKQKYEQEIGEVELQSKICPQEGELEIIYEDGDSLVLNKQPGVVVHPGIGHEDQTLANYVKQYLLKKGSYDVELQRAGIVHRLDMPVSGLIIFAKNRRSQKHLSEQFEKHCVLKIYMADYEVLGGEKLFKDFKKIEKVFELIEQYKNDLTLDLGDWQEISGSMKRDPANRKRMLFQKSIYDERLRYAQSYILPLSESRMCVLIKTGRMHQIRATLKSLGVVLKGDALYGWKKEVGHNIGLRSVVLGFVDMEGKKKLFNIINTSNV